MPKVNNNNVKGALASLSLATVLGGWALLGFNDRRQALANVQLESENFAPSPASSVEVAANRLPVVEAVSVADLVTPAPSLAFEISDLSLDPIPQVGKASRAEPVDLPPLPGPPNAGNTGSAGDNTDARQAVDRPARKVERIPSFKLPPLPEISRSSGPSVAPTPSFNPLPPLPDLPNFEPPTASSVNLPPIPSVKKPTPAPTPAPTPKTIIQTKTS